MLLTHKVKVKYQLSLCSVILFLKVMYFLFILCTTWLY